MGAGELVSLFGLAVSLVIAALLVFVLPKQLKRYPWVFYLVALAACVAFVWVRAGDVHSLVIRWLSPVFQKGYMAIVLLLIVMFCGVLEEGSSLRKRIQPIRGELSILSFIFILAHIACYLPSYLPRLGFIYANQTLLAVSLTIAGLLTLLFGVLAVTSFTKIRTAMKPASWKHLQQFSYLMMAMLLAHIGFVLGGSAMRGGTVAAWTFGIYCVIIVAYAALRVAKAIRDSKQKNNVVAEKTQA